MVAAPKYVGGCSRTTFEITTTCSGVCSRDPNSKYNVAKKITSRVSICSLCIFMYGLLLECRYLLLRRLLRVRLHEHISALSNVLTSLKDALGDCATVFTEEEAVVPRAVSITVCTLCEGVRGEGEARLDRLRGRRHGGGTIRSVGGRLFKFTHGLARPATQTHVGCAHRTRGPWRPSQRRQSQGLPHH